MTRPPTTPVTGTAAGVPFTALPPCTGDRERRAPLVVTWHMMDAPCTDAAFAAALPLYAVPAWRVHLGMPYCGARAGDGAGILRTRARRDAMTAYVEPVVREAACEFPAALAELHRQLPTTGPDAPVALVGASLGAAVALSVLADQRSPVGVVALINPAVRARSVVRLVEGVKGLPYPWTAKAAAAADRLDFVARAADIAARTPQPPVLLVSGGMDHSALRTDCGDLTAALRERYTDLSHVRMTTVPDLAHPLAVRPGTSPAPQLPTAKAVDEAITDWLLLHLA